MSILQDLLYWLTAGLLVPCIAFLLFLFAKGVILSAREYVLVKNEDKQLNAILEQIDQQKSIDDTTLKCGDLIKKIQTHNDKSVVHHKVAEFEVAIEKHLAKFGNMAKLGPITGLVGTLIPMGPALQGLANGDIQQLAGQMQIAFTTTVIGLIVGAIGFITYQFSKRQAVRELALIDLLIDKKWPE